MISSIPHERGRALAQISHLRRILQICAYSKRVRNERNCWQTVEG